MPARPRSPVAEPLSEDAARVLRRFRVVFNAVKTHFRSVERDAGISGAQAWALSVVRDHPGIGVGALAKAMDVHQSTASNLLRPLLAAQLVRAERVASDKRAVQLHATPQGLKVLKKAPGPFTGVLPQALAALDDKTLRRLDRDMARLIEALGVSGEGSRIPLGR